MQRQQPIECRAGASRKRLLAKSPARLPSEHEGVGWGGEQCATDCAWEIGLRHCNPKLSVYQCVESAPYCKAERRRAACHGLQKRDPEPFARRRHHENIGQSIGLDQGLSPNRPHKMDAVTNTGDA